MRQILVGNSDSRILNDKLNLIARAKEKNSYKAAGHIVFYAVFGEVENYAINKVLTAVYAAAAREVG